MNPDSSKLPERKMSELPLSVLLEKIDGTQIAAQLVKSTQPIAEGGRGKIYNAEVLIGEKKIPFIYKMYTGDFPERRAKEAFQKYRWIKNAGLKVFNTFRLVESEGGILMTNGSTNESVCVSSNFGGSTSLNAFGHERLESIANFDELIAESQAQAKLAAEKEIALHYHVPLFLINKKMNTIDFVFGDFDTIDQFSDRVPIETRIKRNQQEIYNALSDIILGNIKEPEKYMQKLKEKFA